MLDFLCVLLIATFQKGFYDAWLLGLAVLTVSFITAGGAAINDYFDRDSDALSHPERPVPSHKISPAGTAWFSAVTFLLGLGISFTINSIAFAIVAVNVVLFIAYPRVVKRFSGFLSNLVMGYLGATIALFAGAVVFQAINVASLSFVGLIAGGAIGLNVLKDILTLEGDVSIRYPTLAAIRGVRVAAVVGALFLLFSVITSPLPLLVGVVSVAYLFPIVVWGGGVVVTAVPLLRAPNIENVRERLRTFTTYFPYIVGAAGIAYVLPFAILGAS
jgi:geranylgeranylglycerol-phosphate geranylgeranyltransferase